jgi:enoyl-CoA hydratase/carnithine racemase
MCLLGRPQTAERLHGLGVVTTLTEPGQAFAAARDLAAELAEGAGHAQSRIRALLRAAPDRDLEAMLNLEADVMAEAQGHPEAVEGISAFLEKRAPKFPRDRG